MPSTDQPHPFRVSDALAAGIGAGRLRGRDLARPFHGIRVAADAATTPEQSYAPLLRPGDRFSHTSAARLWHVPLPGWVGSGVHVTAEPGVVRPRGAGVHGHEGAGVVTTTRHGLPVSDPPTMFLELAGLLRLEELVAVGDHLIHHPRIAEPGDTRPHLDVDELREWLDHSTARGVKRARAAAVLLRPGVESPRETRLRLLLLGAGMPEPVCGVRWRDLRRSRADRVVRSGVAGVEGGGGVRRRPAPDQRSAVRTRYPAFRSGLSGGVVGGASAKAGSRGGTQ